MYGPHALGKIGKGLYPSDRPASCPAAMSISAFRKSHERTDRVTLKFEGSLARSLARSLSMLPESVCVTYSTHDLSRRLCMIDTTYIYVSNVCAVRPSVRLSSRARSRHRVTVAFLTMNEPTFLAKLSWLPCCHLDVSAAPLEGGSFIRERLVRGEERKMVLRYTKALLLLW